MRTVKKSLASEKDSSGRESPYHCKPDRVRKWDRLPWVFWACGNGGTNQFPRGRGGQTVWALVGNTSQNLRALFSSHVHFAHRTLRQLVINQNYWIICTCCKCLYQWVSPLLILTGDRTAMLCESKKRWGCHMLSITNSYQPIKILHSPQQPLWLASIGKSHDTVTHDTVKVALGFLVSCLRTQMWTETSAFSQSVLSSFFLKRIPFWGRRLVRDYFYTTC